MPTDVCTAFLLENYAATAIIKNTIDVAGCRGTQPFLDVLITRVMHVMKKIAAITNET
jgi:hypothetical protein